jgi:two-component system nitrate/nitrite response regulator NarL
MLRTNIRPASNKVTVLVADSTAMDCQLLSQAIQRHSYLRVTGQTSSSAETISAVSESQPDVAVISARLQDGAFAGLLALRGLRSLQTRSRIVLLLDKEEQELIVDAFLNNAPGIFCRMGSSGELRKCIQSVSEGEIWVNNSQLEYIVEALMQAPVRRLTSGRVTAVLSKREEEIAQLVASGLSNFDVSDKLGLSQHTVKNNLSRIFEKLGISTRIELVLYILSQSKVGKANNSLAFPSPRQLST